MTPYQQQVGQSTGVTPHAEGLPPAAFGAGLGRGAEYLGGSILDAQARQRAKDADAAASDALIDLEAWSGTALDGPGGLSEKTGLDSRVAGDAVLKGYGEKMAELRAKLPPEAQAQFDRQARGRLNDLTSRVRRKAIIDANDYYEDAFQRSGLDSTRRSGDRASRGEVDPGAKVAVLNEDGSFSTERSVTLEQDGRYYNVPSLVGGEQLSDEEVAARFGAGQLDVLGEYATQQEAEQAAAARSASIIPDGVELDAAQRADDIRAWAEKREGSLPHGMSKETFVREAIAEDRDARTQAVMDGLLSRPDSALAVAYWDKHKESVRDPKERAQIENRVQAFGAQDAMEAVAFGLYDATKGMPGAVGDEEATIAEREAEANAQVEKMPPGARKKVGDLVHELFSDELKRDNATKDALFNKFQDKLLEGVPIDTLRRRPEYPAMGGERQKKLDKHAEAYSKGESAVTDGPTWTRLMNLYKKDPNAFLEVRPRQLTAEQVLSKEDADEITAKQAAILKASKGDAAEDRGYRTRLRITEKWAELAGISGDREAAFENRVGQLERELKAAGTNTDEEYERMVQREAIKTSISKAGWALGAGHHFYLYEMGEPEMQELLSDLDELDLEKIPQADQDDIRAQFQADGKAPPSDDEIKREFVQTQLEILRSLR